MITLYFYTDTQVEERSFRDLSVTSELNTDPDISQRYKITAQVQENDSSYRYRALMARPQLVLKFSLPFYIEFPLGTYCEYQSERYILNQNQNIKKNGERKIEYTLNMGNGEETMSLYKMRNSVDHRLKYSLCSTPLEFLSEIVQNLNDREGAGKWSVGECIEATEKTIEFNHTNCEDALQSVCDTFETEYEINNFQISLHRVEYFKNNPLPLSYGRGNGFIPGIGRTTASDERPIKRLYVQGSDRNIDRSKYGSADLLLPKSQQIEYEGRTYQSDSQGFYIERVDKVSDAIKEDSLDCDEIYPSRVGETTSVEVINASKNFYDIIDNTIPQNLNYNDYMIAGERLTMIFQSGLLAGNDKEFEVTYKHSERRFEIVPQEIDGITMPNETFKPQKGDKYAIFGCMLPDAYLCDNESKSGASWDMMREAARYMYEHEDQKFTFTGTLQGLYSKQNWGRIGGYLKVGSYIRFSDEQFAPEGVDIRITGVKDFLTTPYSPTIEISNSVSGKTVGSQLKEIDNQEVVISDTKRSIIQYTKRRFRDTQETIEMLNELVENGFSHFSEAITPISVQTMSLLVGDESLQFRFVISREDLTPQDLTITYNTVTKRLNVPSGYLQHMTLGIDTLAPSHENSEYKIWHIGEFVSSNLTDPSKKYYLYAKVERDHTDTDGVFVLSETAIAMESDGDYYYLLVGILNSEYNEDRSFATLYGFSEILPGRVTTDKIVSQDGLNFLDLLNNALHLGNAENYLDWNSEEAATLVMSNATIKNALKVLGEALIAGFYFSNSLMRSQHTTSKDQSSIEIDGIRGKITLRSDYSGSGMGDYDQGMSTDVASTIELDSSNGQITVRSEEGVSYVTPNGIFCNHAMINALPSSSGYTHYGAIVGLGFGNVDNDWYWEKESTIIAGLYGRASNRGTALAYGAYIWDLLAAGLIYRQKYVTDSHATTAYNISSNVTQIVSLSNSGVTAKTILPSDGMEGKVIYVKQIGAGAVRIQPKSGQHLYDDNSENTYYDLGCGEEAKFTFAHYTIGGTSTEVWLVSRWKF